MFFNTGKQLISQSFLLGNMQENTTVSSNLETQVYLSASKTK